MSNTYILMHKVYYIITINSIPIDKCNFLLLDIWCLPKKAYRKLIIKNPTIESTRTLMYDRG